MPVTFLELENFKSYAGIQRIGPFKDFTSIIGPNGSGKSNLMDAISFILGVQSRDLRSHQMRDLIYRPPDRRKTNESERESESESDDSNRDRSKSPKNLPLLRASATLVYQHPEDPNLITRFSRAISSKGQGEYRINGAVVSFAQYERSLANIGILLAARNFLVFQGDVESLTRKTPKQLAQLFEQVSGSEEFRDRYDTALKERDEAEAATLFSYNKLKGFKSERKALKLQKEEAERYHALLEKKAALNTEYFLWQLYHIQADVTEKENHCDELREEINECVQTESSKVDALRIAKKAASTARRVTGAAEKKRVVVAAELDRLQPSIIQATEHVKSLEHKVTADSKALDKIRAEAASHNETKLALEREIQEYTETEEQLRKEYELLKEKATSSTLLSEEHEAEYEQLQEAAAVASAKPRQLLNSQVRKLESTRANAAALTEQIKDIQTQKEEAHERIRELSSRKEKLESSIEQTKTDLVSAEAALQGIQQSVRDAQVRREAIDQELEQLDHKLREARDEHKKNKDDMRLMEAIKNLQRHFPGVHGRLVDLCRPTQRRYNLAVTVAGGKDMDAIVVDTKQIGFDCIQYLRSNQIGTATFLPLDTLKFPSPASTERIRAMLQHDGRYKLACDVITCDDFVRRAVMYAVGNSVICDDLDCARDLCFNPQNRQQGEDARIKAVTIGGAVISKSGTMTGGITNDESSKAGRWDDKEIEKLRAKKESLENERAELDNMSIDESDSMKSRRSSRDGVTAKIDEHRNHVGNLRNRLQYSQNDMDYTGNKLKEQLTLVNSIDKQIKHLQDDLKQVESEIPTLVESVQSAAKNVQDVEEKYFAPFREKTGIKDCRAYDEAMGKSREEYKKKRRSILQHLEKLKAQKNYEDGRDFQVQIATKEKSLKERSEQLASAREKEADVLACFDRAQSKLTEAETEVEQATQLENEEEKKVRMIQNEYKETQSELARLNKEVNNEEANLEKLRSKLHETLLKARVEEAEVPVIRDKNISSDEGTSTTIGKTRSSVRRAKPDSDNEVGNISQQTSDTFSQFVSQESSASIHFSQSDDIHVRKDRKIADKIDFGSLSSDLKQRLSDAEEKRARRNFEEQLSKISNEIAGLSPNMKAGDAFESVSEKIQESTDEFNKAKDASMKASSLFLEIKESRAKCFNDAFSHIDAALKTIYNDMTKSSKHPLGGNAYLSLDDLEEPYKGGVKFNAMPPMKRFRDMEQLSGGEKTVAALALLFAIHSFRPSPFFVMDEVDAALDNVNVQKVCNYISRRSKDFQFLVISLKDTFYEKSHGIVGICRNVSTNSSKTLTLDLTKFDSAQAEKEDDVSKASDGRKRHRNSWESAQNTSLDSYVSKQ